MATSHGPSVAVATLNTNIREASSSSDEDVDLTRGVRRRECVTNEAPCVRSGASLHLDIAWSCDVRTALARLPPPRKSSTPSRRHALDARAPPEDARRKLHHLRQQVWLPQGPPEILYHVVREAEDGDRRKQQKCRTYTVHCHGMKRRRGRQRT